MNLRDDALAVLRRWRPPNEEQATLRELYLAHLDAHPDGLRRSCLPDHVTASVLVFDQPGARLLLTLHAKSGRWFQFGGHAEPGDASLAGAALREALEESGLPEADLVLDPVPVLLDAHVVPFCGPDGDTRHLDVMFRATARDGASHAVSDESDDVAWWPLDDLPNPELAPFAALALARGPQSTSSGGGSSFAAVDHPSR